MNAPLLRQHTLSVASIPKNGYERTTTLIEYANGIFQGQIENKTNQKNGLGVFSFDNGDFYFGEWENDMIQGEGILFFAFGGFVHGFFSANQLEGPAFLKFSNGEVYEGFWQKGCLHGEAFNYFVDESMWLKCRYNQGSFEALLQEGNSRPPSKILSYLSDAKGLSEKHRTKENPRVKVLDYKDGGQYLGAAQGSKPWGLGAVRRLDGKSDVGFFQNGVSVDIGRLNLQDGGLYDGLIKNGQLHGRGVYYKTSDHSWFYGQFDQGECKEVSKSGQGDYPLDIIEKIRRKHHKQSGRFVNVIIADRIFQVPSGHTSKKRNSKSCYVPSSQKNIEEFSYSPINGQPQQQQQYFPQKQLDNYGRSSQTNNNGIQQYSSNKVSPFVPLDNVCISSNLIENSKTQKIIEKSKSTNQIQLQRNNNNRISNHTAKELQTISNNNRTAFTSQQYQQEQQQSYGKQTSGMSSATIQYASPEQSNRTAPTTSIYSNRTVPAQLHEQQSSIPTVRNTMASPQNQLFLSSRTVSMHSQNNHNYNNNINNYYSTDEVKMSTHIASVASPPSQANQVFNDENNSKSNKNIWQPQKIEKQRERLYSQDNDALLLKHQLRVEDAQIYSQQQQELAAYQAEQAKKEKEKQMKRSVSPLAKLYEHYSQKHIQSQPNLPGVPQRGRTRSNFLDVIAQSNNNNKLNGLHTSKEEAIRKRFITQFTDNQQGRNQVIYRDTGTNTTIKNDQQQQLIQQLQQGQMEQQQQYQGQQYYQQSTRMPANEYKQQPQPFQSQDDDQISQDQMQQLLLLSPQTSIQKDLQSGLILGKNTNDIGNFNANPADSNLLQLYNQALENDEDEHNEEEYQNVLGKRNEAILNSMLDIQKNSPLIPINNGLDTRSSQQLQKGISSKQILQQDYVSGMDGVFKRDDLINFQSQVIGIQDTYINKLKRSVAKNRSNSRSPSPMIRNIHGETEDNEIDYRSSQLQQQQMSTPKYLASERQDTQGQQQQYSQQLREQRDDNEDTFDEDYQSQRQQQQQQHQSKQQTLQSYQQQQHQHILSNQYDTLSSEQQSSQQQQQQQQYPYQSTQSQLSSVFSPQSSIQVTSPRIQGLAAYQSGSQSQIVGAEGVSPGSRSYLNKLKQSGSPRSQTILEQCQQLPVDLQEAYIQKIKGIYKTDIEDVEETGSRNINERQQQRHINQDNYIDSTHGSASRISTQTVTPQNASTNNSTPTYAKQNSEVIKGQEQYQQDYQSNQKGIRDSQQPNNRLSSHEIDQSQQTATHGQNGFTQQSQTATAASMRGTNPLRISQFAKGSKQLESEDDIIASATFQFQPQQEQTSQSEEKLRWQRSGGDGLQQQQQFLQQQQQQVVETFGGSGSRILDSPGIQLISYGDRDKQYTEEILISEEREENQYQQQQQDLIESRNYQQQGAQKNQYLKQSTVSQNGAEDSQVDQQQAMIYQIGQQQQLEIQSQPQQTSPFTQGGDNISTKLSQTQQENQSGNAVQQRQSSQSPKRSQQGGYQQEKQYNQQKSPSRMLESQRQSVISSQNPTLSYSSHSINELNPTTKNSQTAINDDNNNRINQSRISNQGYQSPLRNQHNSSSMTNKSFQNQSNQFIEQIKKSGILSSSSPKIAPNEEEKFTGHQNQDYQDNNDEEEQDQEDNNFDNDAKNMRGSMMNQSQEKTLNASRVGSSKGNQEYYLQQSYQNNQSANNISGSGLIRRSNKDLSNISIANQDTNQHSPSSLLTASMRASLIGVNQDNNDDGSAHMRDSKANYEQPIRAQEQHAFNQTQQQRQQISSSSISPKNNNRNQNQIDVSLGIQEDTYAADNNQSQKGMINSSNQDLRTSQQLKSPQKRNNSQSIINLEKCLDEQQQVQQYSPAESTHSRRQVSPEIQQVRQISPGLSGNKDLRGSVRDNNTNNQQIGQTIEDNNKNNYQSSSSPKNTLNRNSSSLKGSSLSPQQQQQEGRQRSQSPTQPQNQHSQQTSQLSPAVSSPKRQSSPNNRQAQQPEFQNQNEQSPRLSSNQNVSIQNSQKQQLLSPIRQQQQQQYQQPQEQGYSPKLNQQQQQYQDTLSPAKRRSPQQGLEKYSNQEEYEEQSEQQANQMHESYDNYDSRNNSPLAKKQTYMQSQSQQQQQFQQSPQSLRVPSPSSRQVMLSSEIVSQQKLQQQSPLRQTQQSQQNNSFTNQPTSPQRTTNAKSNQVESDTYHQSSPIRGSSSSPQSIRKSASPIRQNQQQQSQNIQQSEDDQAIQQQIYEQQQQQNSSSPNNKIESTQHFSSLTPQQLIPSKLSPIMSVSPNYDEDEEYENYSHHQSQEQNRQQARSYSDDDNAEDENDDQIKRVQQKASVNQFIEDPHMKDRSDISDIQISNQAQVVQFHNRSPQSPIKSPSKSTEQDINQQQQQLSRQDSRSPKRTNINNLGSSSSLSPQNVSPKTNQNHQQQQSQSPIATRTSQGPVTQYQNAGSPIRNENRNNNQINQSNSPLQDKRYHSPIQKSQVEKNDLSPAKSQQENQRTQEEQLSGQLLKDENLRDSRNNFDNSFKSSQVIQNSPQRTINQGQPENQPRDNLSIKTNNQSNSPKRQTQSNSPQRQIQGHQQQQDDSVSISPKQLHGESNTNNSSVSPIRSQSQLSGNPESISQQQVYQQDAEEDRYLSKSQHFQSSTSQQLQQQQQQQNLRQSSSPLRASPNSKGNQAVNNNYNQHSKQEQPQEYEEQQDYQQELIQQSPTKNTQGQSTRLKSMSPIRVVKQPATQHFQYADNFDENEEYQSDNREEQAQFVQEQYENEEKPFRIEQQQQQQQQQQDGQLKADQHNTRDQNANSRHSPKRDSHKESNQIYKESPAIRQSQGQIANKKGIIDEEGYYENNRLDDSEQDNFEQAKRTNNKESSNNSNVRDSTNQQQQDRSDNNTNNNYNFNTFSNISQGYHVKESVPAGSSPISSSNNSNTLHKTTATMGSKNESLLQLKPSGHHTSMPTYLQDDTLENNNTKDNDGDNTQDNNNNNINANNMTAPANQIIRNVTFNDNNENTTNISSVPIGIHQSHIFAVSSTPPSSQAPFLQSVTTNIPVNDNNLSSSPSRMTLLRGSMTKNNSNINSSPLVILSQITSSPVAGTVRRSMHSPIQSVPGSVMLSPVRLTSPSKISGFPAVITTSGGMVVQNQIIQQITPIVISQSPHRIQSVSPVHGTAKTQGLVLQVASSNNNNISTAPTVVMPSPQTIIRPQEVVTTIVTSPVMHSKRLLDFSQADSNNINNNLQHQQSSSSSLRSSALSPHRQILRPSSSQIIIPQDTAAPGSPVKIRNDIPAVDLASSIEQQQREFIQSSTSSSSPIRILGLPQHNNIQQQLQQQPIQQQIQVEQKGQQIQPKQKFIKITEEVEEEEKELQYAHSQNQSAPIIRQQLTSQQQHQKDTTVHSNHPQQQYHQISMNSSASLSYQALHASCPIVPNTHTTPLKQYYQLSPIRHSQLLNSSSPVQYLRQSQNTLNQSQVAASMFPNGQVITSLIPNVHISSGQIKQSPLRSSPPSQHYKEGNIKEKDVSNYGNQSQEREVVFNDRTQQQNQVNNSTKKDNTNQNRTSSQDNNNNKSMPSSSPLLFASSAYPVVPQALDAEATKQLVQKQLSSLRKSQAQLQAYTNSQQNPHSNTNLDALESNFNQRNSNSNIAITPSRSFSNLSSSAQKNPDELPHSARALGAQLSAFRSSLSPLTAKKPIKANSASKRTTSPAQSEIPQFKSKGGNSGINTPRQQSYSQHVPAVDFNKLILPRQIEVSHNRVGSSVDFSQYQSVVPSLAPPATQFPQSCKAQAEIQQAQLKASSSVNQSRGNNNHGNMSNRSNSSNSNNNSGIQQQSYQQKEQQSNFEIWKSEQETKKNELNRNQQEQQQQQIQEYSDSKVDNFSPSFSRDKQTENIEESKQQQLIINSERASRQQEISNKPNRAMSSSQSPSYLAFQSFLEKQPSASAKKLTNTNSNAISKTTTSQIAIPVQLSVASQQKTKSTPKQSSNNNNVLDNPELSSGSNMKDRLQNIRKIEDNIRKLSESLISVVSESHPNNTTQPWQLLEGEISEINNNQSNNISQNVRQSGNHNTSARFSQKNQSIHNRSMQSDESENMNPENDLSSAFGNNQAIGNAYRVNANYQSGNQDNSIIKDNNNNRNHPSNNVNPSNNIKKNISESRGQQPNQQNQSDTAATRISPATTNRTIPSANVSYLPASNNPITQQNSQVPNNIPRSTSVNNSTILSQQQPSSLPVVLMQQSPNRQINQFSINQPQQVSPFRSPLTRIARQQNSVLQQSSFISQTNSSPSYSPITQRLSASQTRLQALTPVRSVRQEVIYKTSSPLIIQDHQQRVAHAQTQQTSVSPQKVLVMPQQQQFVTIPVSTTTAPQTRIISSSSRIMSTSGSRIFSQPLPQQLHSSQVFGQQSQVEVQDEIVRISEKTSNTNNNSSSKGGCLPFCSSDKGKTDEGEIQVRLSNAQLQNLQQIKQQQQLQQATQAQIEQYKQQQLAGGPTDPSECSIF